MDENKKRNGCNTFVESFRYWFILREIFLRVLLGLDRDFIENRVCCLCCYFFNESRILVLIFAFIKVLLKQVL